MRRSTPLLAIVFASIIPLIAACQNDPQAEAITEAINLRAEGSDANSRGDWDHAIDVFTRVIELSPEVAGAYAYNERAYAYGHSGEIGLAINDLTRAIEIDAENPIGFNQRALYYNDLGRWEEAVADLDRAIELRPERADQYNGRAFANLNLGNFQAVVSDLTRALELEPDSPLASIYLANRAAALFELDQLDLAIADYEASLALDPSNWSNHLEWASAMTKVGLLDEAVAELKSVLGDAATPSVVLSVRAAALGGAGRLAEAIAVQDEILELDPNSPGIWAQRGVFLAKLGETERARASFQEAITRTSDPALIAQIELELESLLEPVGAGPVG